MTPETLHFDDDGAIPNSPLPVLVYHGVDDSEALFARNGWGGGWRNGIFDFHHFHSTAHEVLGILAGATEVILGGPSGRQLEIRAGDVVVLPAGTGHCRIGSRAGLLVAGAYPRGQTWDLRRGDPAEHEEVLANIARVPLPETDPVGGPTGSLVELWAT